MNILDKFKSFARKEGLSDEEIDSLVSERMQQQAKERERNRASYEQRRDGLVKAVVSQALDLSADLKQWKDEVFRQVDEFYDLLKEYGDIKQDNRGTFSMICAAESGQVMKVEVQAHRTGTFDERADVAAQKVDKYLQNRVNDAPLYEFITDLMEKKNGEFDPRNIQKLYQYEDQFNSPLYSEAMELFRESYQLVDSARYIRFYTKTDGGKWQPVNLNFANL